MANLRTAVDSQFWDQPISSSQTLEGCAYSIPGDPFPLEVTRASKALRVQQLSVLGNGFPLGTIPSFSPTSTKDLGSFSLQSLFLKLATSTSWLGLIGQFRPKKLISSIKGEFTNADEFEWAAFKDVAKHVFDKSIYSLGLFSQISLSSSSVLLSTERHGDKRRPRYKMMLWHEGMPSGNLSARLLILAENLVVDNEHTDTMRLVNQWRHHLLLLDKFLLLFSSRRERGRKDWSALSMDRMPGTCVVYGSSIMRSLANNQPNLENQNDN